MCENNEPELRYRPRKDWLPPEWRLWLQTGPHDVGPPYRGRRKRREALTRLDVLGLPLAFTACILGGVILLMLAKESAALAFIGLVVLISLLFGLSSGNARS